jgi:hypothetical protein
MRTDDRHLTQDLDAFLARAGGFLRSQLPLHTLPLTVTENLRTRGRHIYGDGTPEFGVLEQDGAVRATFFRTPPHRLNLTVLTAEEADALAARLAGRGQRLPGVPADRDTATAFAEAWQRHTGATVTLRERQRLYRLGTLTVPRPVPPGRPRIAGKTDREQLIRWHEEFAKAVGTGTVRNATEWADTRIEQGGITFWEPPTAARPPWPERPLRSPARSVSPRSTPRPTAAAVATRAPPPPRSAAPPWPPERRRCSSSRICRTRPATACTSGSGTGR